MTRIKEVIAGRNFQLSLANQKGIIQSDVPIVQGYMKANKQKIKVDIPLDGKPIYGLVKVDQEVGSYDVIVYFIIEEDESK